MIGRASDLLRSWGPLPCLGVGITSFLLLGAANQTSAPPSEGAVALGPDGGPLFDTAPPSDAAGSSKADAGPPRWSTELWEPVFSSRSSTTVGPAAAQDQLPPAEAARPDAGDLSFVATLDLEAGFNPLHDAAPLTFGAGLGFRALTTPSNPIGPSFRFAVVTMTLIDAMDEYTDQRNQTALWGAIPLFADFDLYGRLNRTFRLGFGTRAGLYFAPRLYPLFAVGLGLAADVGSHRFELMARLQPLPTAVSTNAVSGEEIWARSLWIIVPTFRVSLPIAK